MNPKPRLGVEELDATRAARPCSPPRRAPVPALVTPAATALGVDLGGGGDRLAGVETGRAW